MQAMSATTRAPRATLHRELRHPTAQNVPRDSLNQQTPCEHAHVKPLYRTRQIDSGSNEPKETDKESKLYPN